MVRIGALIHNIKEVFIMSPKQEFYKIQAEEIIKKIKMRGMNGIYCRSKEDAKKCVLDMIEDGASVAWGGSESLKETGILDAVMADKERLDVIDRCTYVTDEQKRELKGKIAMCDYFLMSTNAITLDGELVNIDGAGSRLSYLIYGPEKVIIVAGMNKVSTDVEDAVKRVRNIASPPNAIRLSCDTPCAKYGRCMNCISDDSICCQVVVTRRSRIINRINVILVGEELGY